MPATRKVTLPPKPRQAVWTPPHLTGWQREAMEQGYFDFAVPKWERLLTSQVAKALTMSRQSVVELVEAGQLEAWRKCITGQRVEYTISRRSALLYLASTATLDPRDLIARAAEWFHALDDRMIAGVRAALIAEMNRRAL